MAILSLETGQFFIVLVPILVIALVAGFNFPNKPNFVQKFLSILSNFLFGMNVPLVTNPLPKSLVLLVQSWHDTMTILSFKIDELFILFTPVLVERGLQGYQLSK
jgi:hypothetical protein